MPDFALKSIETTGRINFISLLVIDGKCPFDDFYAKMRKAGKRKELVRVQTYLDQLSRGLDLPPKAFRPLKGRPIDDDWPEYELRIDRLRVYLFYQPTSHCIVVCGELKKGNKNQRKTIASMQEWKQAYRHHFLAKKTEEE